MSSPTTAASAWWPRGLLILRGRGGDTLLRLAIFPATALVLTGPDFSQYALLTAALATGQSLFALGAPRVAAFFHRHGERRSLFGWLILLAGGPPLLAAAVFAAWPTLRTFWFGSVPPRLFWIGMAPLPFLLLADSLSATLLAEHRERLYSFFLWGRTLASGAVLATGLFSSARLDWLLWGRLAVNAAAAGGLLLAAGVRPGLAAAVGLTGPALRFGAPAALAGLAVALHRRADVFLLSALGRAGEIGAYALAYAMAESLWILADSLEAALFVDLSARPTAQARSIAATALAHFRTLSWGSAAAILVGGEAVLFLFLRSRYPTAPALLPPLLVGVAASGSARPATSFLYAAGRGKAVAVCQMAALGANLALCGALIPRWGALGASGASMVSYALAGAALKAEFRRGSPAGS